MSPLCAAPLVDKNTKQILKVGETTVGSATGRWTQYVGRAKAEAREIEIRYVRFVTPIRPLFERAAPR